MNTRNHFKLRFLRVALMLTLAVMTFPIEAWAQTAYATLTDNGKTLTFKYDNDYDTYYPNSNEWDVSNTGSSTPGWYSNRKNITTVVFEDEFARANPKSCYQWFYGCENLTTITGLENLNTEEVVNMESMFKDCHSLTSLNVSSFNTEEVVNMESMFEDCHSLTSLNVSSFNTGKVQNMKQMFRDCSRLTSLDLSSFKTREAQGNMDRMLYGCSSLANLTIGSDFTLDIDFTSVYLFSECTALANGMLIVKGTVEDNKLKPSIAEDIFKNVFINGTLVSNLTKEQLGITGTSSPYTWKGGSFTSFLPGRPYAKLSNDKKTLTFKCDKDKFTLGDNEWDVINTGTSEPGWSNYRGNITTVVFDASFADVRPKSCCKWFERCTNLSTIEGLRNLNTSEVTDMSYMFGYCSNLFSVTLPADVKSIDNGAFKDCSLLASITIPASVTKINKSAFEGCTSLATVYALPSTAPTLGDDAFKSVPTTCKYYVHGTGYDAWSIDDENKTIIWAATPGTKVTTATPVVSHGGKDYYTEGATVALGYSGEVPEGYSLVYTATKTSDNSDVTSTVISGSTLTMPAYDISVTATLKERTAYAVLSEDGKTLTFKCGVHTLAATNEWDVSNTGTSIPGWCPTDLSTSANSTITTVEFDESFADARPKSCNHWFYFLINLTTIKGLNYLNTSEVTDMNSMFCHCQKLTSLDLSSFNTSKVTDMAIMFQLCRNLTNLDLSSFDTSNVKHMFNMFFGCRSLTNLTIGSGFTIGSGTSTTDMFSGCTALADGMLIVNGTTPPSIAQNIFEGVFTNGTLATKLTKNDLGITGSSSPYKWKGGTFKSVGKVKIPYIDENGKLHNDATSTTETTDDDCAEALPITSSSNGATYPGGWYFVAGNVNIHGQLKFTGDAHIILCDGAKMTVTSTDGHAIYGKSASLAIYGQSTGNDMGSLTATGYGAGIYAYSSNGNSSVTINGGQVTTTGGTNGDGILANSLNGGNSSVIINGGQVNSTGGTNGDGIQAYSPNGGNSSVIINGGQVNATGGTKGDGIQAYSPNGGNSSVIINGGQVTATGGNDGNGIRAFSTYGEANITLSWTNPNDYIYANGYSLIGRTKNMKTATGKRFVAYDAPTGTTASTIVSGTVSDLSTIAGKTLRPLNGYTVSTTDSNISLKNGTTTKTADFTSGTTSYYIYPANTSTPTTITLSYSGEVPTGYAPVYTAKKTSDNSDVTSTVISGSTLTMPYYDVTIAATVQSTALGANGYEAVDLGLPSGLLWATCNVGATTPYGYGDYFAWGETTTKNSYDWNSYKYSNGDSNKLTKYCKNESEGYNNFTDNLSMLEAGDDAAKANWGGGWRIPTKAEWEELIEGTEQSLIKQNGVDGVLFTATNGNTLFLPAAGRKKDNDLDLIGDCVYYWSSTMNDEENIKAYNTTNPAYETISREMGKKFRYQGLPVRAVITKAAYTAPVFDLSFTPSGKFSIAKGNASVYVGDSTDPAEMKSGTETLKEKVANGTTVTLKAASGYKFKSPRGEHLLTVITPTGSGDPTPKYSVEGVARLEMEDDVNCSDDDYWYSNMPTEMGKLKVTAENGYSITRLLVGLVNPCENIPYKEIDGKKYYDMPSLEKIYITDGHAIYYSSGGDITIDNSGVSEFRVYGYKKDEGVLGQLSADGTEFSFTMPSDDTVVPYELEGLGVTLSVPAQQFITYCSDQALTLGDGQSDAALYTISKVGTDAVTLSAVAGTASAGTPLLVWNGNTTAQDIFLGYAAAPETETAHADEFKGTTTTKEFSADDMMDKQCYVLAGGKMFVRVEGAGTIAAHRCWLELPNSNTNAARSLVIIGNDDEPTGIDRMDNGQWIMDNYSGAWFSLDGRKLEGQPKRKGVYIRNGKKIAQSRRER